MAKRFYLDDVSPIGGNPIISTTGTAPGVNINRPLSVASNIYVDYITRGMSLADVRRNLYDYLNPRGYESSISANLSRFENAINKIPDKQIKQNVILEGKGYDPQLDDIWATYLNIPKNKRHTNINKQWNAGLPTKRVIPSKYKPTKGNQNNKYYTLSNINNEELSALVNEGSKLNYNESALSKALYDSLHQHTVSKGHDNKGTYVSFYDLWDVAPIYNSSNYQGGLSDQSGGIGTPINFYDRIYLDDYYGVPRNPRSNYIPEIIIKPNEEWGRKHYPSLYK